MLEPKLTNVLDRLPRRLDQPELLPEVALGVRIEDGVRGVEHPASEKQPWRRAA